MIKAFSIIYKYSILIPKKKKKHINKFEFWNKMRKKKKKKSKIWKL